MRQVNDFVDFLNSSAVASMGVDDSRYEAVILFG